MNAVIASSVLDAWEDCQRRGHAAVAVRLLQLAEPPTSHERLGDLTIGHRDHLLISLYESHFGRKLDVRTSCPTCGEELEVAAEIDEFRRDADVDGMTHELVVESYLVRFRLPSSVDVAAACGADDGESRVRALWKRCVRVTNGDGQIDPGDAPDVVRSLVEAEMYRLDAQAVAQLDVECPTCLTSWAADFDVVPILWTEIDNRVRRHLFEVHRLAEAYGWTEDTVLALGPARRNFYLGQI